MKNRDGWDVEIHTLTEVSDDGEYYQVTKDDDWSFVLKKSDCGTLVPTENDVAVFYTNGFTTICGVTIDGHVIFYKTKDQIEKEHQQFCDSIRLRNLENYVKNSGTLKARVEKLHPALKARMERFDKESGIEFWIESAEYEMYALEGAQALLDKVYSLKFRNNDEGVAWINDWKSKPYEKQQELVPDFGDGHSGWTASAAIGLAIRVLRGESV